jgi:hypothetical protein
LNREISPNLAKRIYVDDSYRTCDSKMEIRNEMVVTVNRLLFATFLTISLASAAYAETWYLMAPDEKVISEPSAANRMSRGHVVGPIHFQSRADFSSRSECESAQKKLVGEWQKASVMTRGGWSRYRFYAPDVFILCVPSADPRLKESRSGTATSRSMNITLNKR